MNAVIGFIFILLLGYVGSQVALFQDRFSVGIQSLYFSGIEFLFVGLALGPHGVNLVSQESLRQLIPVLSLGLGWMGLLIGMQFDAKLVIRIPRYAWLVCGLVSIMVFILVFLGIYGGIWGIRYFESGNTPLLTGWPEQEMISFLGPGRQTLSLAIVLGWLGIVSTHTVVALLKRSIDARGDTVKLLQWLTDLGSPLAIVMLGLGYSLFHITHMNGVEDLIPSAESIVLQPVMSGILWICVSLLLGISLGWMLHYLTSQRLNASQMLLLTAGTVIFSSGVSTSLHLSPLFVNLVMGITLANLPNFAQGRILSMLLSTEKPFFVVFLILIGALWPPVTIAGLVVVLFYLLFRTFGLFVGARVGVAVGFPSPQKIPRGLGLAMLPQGGVTIALAVDYLLIHPGGMANLILSVVIISVVVNQMIGPVLMLRVLKAGQRAKGVEV